MDRENWRERERDGERDIEREREREKSNLQLLSKNVTGTMYCEMCIMMHVY